MKETHKERTLKRGHGVHSVEKFQKEGRNSRE
ncbi:MAG: hypothetical protein K0S45_2529 [Nitrospira sp.]|jgi:hypothetical protein|nr:hypothetical protein [Nitrospira sp.]